VSTIFTWRAADIDALLETCAIDDVTPLIHEFFPPGGAVLETGCGLGRFVRYLTDRGYRAVGIEWLGDSLRVVHDHWPDLRLLQGDAAATPFASGTFDALLSLGLVEHWPEGPRAPLEDHARVLKPGGVAIITVPLHNGVRRIKRRVWFDEVVGLPRAIAKRLLEGIPLRANRLHAAPYAVYPTYGPFYEYRLTPDELLAAVRSAGFEVIEHRPVGHVDGVYHELNPLGLLVGFDRWRFDVTPWGRALNERLSRRPFLHSHMQAVVARKPLR
jgi:SAM-dependent methyltransferase